MAGTVARQGSGFVFRWSAVVLLAVVLVASAGEAWAEQGGAGSAETGIAQALDLFQRAKMLQGRQEFPEAEALYRQALKSIQTLLGPNHRAMASVSAATASLLLDQKRYTEAEVLYRQALAVYEQTAGGNGLEVAAVLDRLAEICQIRGLSEEAETVLKRALTIREQNLATEDPETLRSLRALLQFYQSRGRAAEAQGISNRLATINNRLQQETADRIAAQNTITIPRSGDHHFRIDATVDDQRLRFLLDTGASAIILTRADAARLGFASDRLEFVPRFRTANGIVRAAAIVLQELKIGSMTFRALSAFVNEGDLSESLLGMALLEKFSTVEIKNDTLVIRR